MYPRDRKPNAMGVYDKDRFTRVGTVADTHFDVYEKFSE